ncbi:MAG: hypothetical protein WCE63_21370 [Acidobacteriaceae bacterium]
MSANKHWTREKAERVLDQIAESIEKGDAVEIAADLKESGQDVNEIASRTKAAALAGIKEFRQQRLHQARQRYQESSSRIERRARRFGGSPEERRRRLFSALESNPGLKSALTMQYRDLNELTDEDIETGLDDLETLGALEESDDTDS